MSAFASDAALVLAHLDCDEKSNEIPAVQTLLAELGLAGTLITVDAMHCQKKTLELAAATDALMIAQVKDNQPTPHRRVDQGCAARPPVDQHTTRDQNQHSRDETRVVEVFDPHNALADTEWAEHVGAIIAPEKMLAKIEVGAD